ncbi:MAG: pilus assembly PilX N-terminal domain-containing protein [Planctomycetota bacterium]|jgi:hypothetical protein
MTYLKSHKGTALLISMIVLAILSAWAIAINSMSGANLQLADNLKKANSARGSAESGLDILRFWLGRVYMPGDTQPNDRFSSLANFLAADLAVSGISNIPIAVYADHVSIGDGGNPVVLHSSAGQYFSAEIQKTGEPNKPLQMDITGSSGAVERTIRVNYRFGTRAHTVFDYGVATKGSLELHGNIAMSGANIELDAGVYIECPNDVNNALSIIGNSQVAGDVHITNPDATIDLQGGQAAIGGETAPEAYDHVFTGIPPTEFPVPDPTYFEHYVTNLYDPNNVLTEYENVRIAAGTNPTFSTVTLKGIVFIETPNIVTFSGNTAITGIIVGNGDLSDNSGTNQIIFLGTVDSNSVDELGPEFGQLRDETGTFLMAPGFSASFGGNFETLNGAIAANGIQFFGDAGGTIEGSVLNYSDTPMVLDGNTDLYFNRSGTNEMPAGFGPEIILYYVKDSYSEVVLGL